jgi:DNA-binding IclR family transcriptional regulator
MTPAPVKSAKRVIEIFEYFAHRQTPATLMDVARALSAPVSSTSALLNSLCQLGYVDYDRRERTFVPTLRAALLGIWINDMFISDGTILSLMHDLREKTSETVAIGTQSGLHVQYIHVMPSLLRRAAPQVASGRLRPLLRSAVGQVILSLKDNQEVQALAHRINAEEKDPANRVKPNELLKKVDACRREGFGYTEGATTPGSGIIAVLLPSPPHQPPMALGIGTTIPKLREQKANYLKMLRQAVEVHGRHMESQFGTRWRGERAVANR